MRKGQTASTHKQRSKRSRPGVHAKTKCGTHKGGKLYHKKYRGQGK